MKAGLLKKNRVIWHISKWFLSLAHCRSIRRISLIFTVRTYRLLGVNLKKLWGPWKTSSLRFQILRIVQTELINQLQFRFSYTSTGFCAHFYSKVFALVSDDSLYLALCLYNPRDSKFPLSQRARKSCWFLSLFIFLFVRMEWQLQAPYMRNQKLQCRIRNWYTF